MDEIEKNELMSKRKITLDVVIRDYSIEQDRKRSFQTRAGTLLSIIFAIVIFTIGNYKLVDFFKLIGPEITACSSVKFVIGILALLAVAISIIMCFKILIPQDTFTINTQDFTEDYYKNSDLNIVSGIQDIFIEFICDINVLNKKLAKFLRFAYISLGIATILFLIFVNL